MQPLRLRLPLMSKYVSLKTPCDMVAGDIALSAWQPPVSRQADFLITNGLFLHLYFAGYVPNS